MPMEGLRPLWTRRAPREEVFPFCPQCHRHVSPVIIHDPAASPPWTEGWNCGGRGNQCGVRPRRDCMARGPDTSSIVEVADLVADEAWERATAAGGAEDFWRIVRAEYAPRATPFDVSVPRPPRRGYFLDG